jgi:hypothetical protein
VSAYVPGCVRVIVGGAVRDLPADTPCIRATQYINGASFESGGVFTYSSDSGADYGGGDRKSHSSINASSIVSMMGQDVYVALPGNNSRGTQGRVESSAEAFARADAAIVLLENQLELAEAKRLLAEATRAGRVAS